MTQVRRFEGKCVIKENCSFQQVLIARGAEITAPEGKQVTMTIGGVSVDMKPGRYSGDIRLTLTDDIPVSFWMGPAMRFKAAACVENGKYIPAKSVAPAVISGGVRDGEARGVEICSRADGINGFYLDGEGDYVISGAKVDLIGNGENDFMGHAAGIMANGKAKLTVNDCEFNVRGVARPAICSGGSTTLTVNNTTVRAYNGTLPPDYVDSIMPGQMICVPWMLGLRGNCRATNLLDYGVARWNNCRLYAEGWGVLSTDGVDVCRLYVKDSHIEITGTSGYGAFSIGDCHDYFDNCTFKMTDYALIAANDNACGSFSNGTVVDSKRFGVMFFNNTGEVNVTDSAFNTEKTTFIVKGCAPEIKVRNAKLNPGNGKILQLFNCDDPGNPEGYYCDPLETDALDPEHDRTKAEKGIDVIAHFADMEINGGFYNGSANSKGDTGPAMDMPPPPPPMGGDDGMPPMEPPGPRYEGVRNLCLRFENVRLSGVITACKSTHRVAKVCQDNCEELGELDDAPCEAINNGVNASFDAKSVWTVTGTSYLTSLQLAEGAVVKGADGKTVAMTVDGVETAVKAGSYEGNITVSVQ